MYDLIIIGAGPAGLTAALYGLRANKTVLVLESKNYGGQIINANNIENYPGIKNISGYDFATNLYNQVINLNGIFKFDQVTKITEDKKVITNKNEYQAKAIIIATGTERRKLNLPNENELIGKGISYCATCDGNFFKNKDVAIIGGGNTALEDTLYLSNIVNKVYLIHRRNEFRGEAKYVEELKNKTNVKLILNSNITSLNGKDTLESITVNNEKIKVQGLFIAIGQVPQNQIFNNVVNLDSNGYIITDNDLHTKTKGIYAAGDTRVKSLRQLTTAVSDGSIAATNAIKEME